jgi:alpha-L-glutamate ligase-like protein
VFFKSRLSKLGILGNNTRIREFILPHNRRQHYPFVDNKLKTSELLIKASIPTPKLYFSISGSRDLSDFHSRIKSYKEFVIKAAKGAMGNGIVIAEEVHWNELKKLTSFKTTRRETLSYPAMMYHLTSILSGLYSLSGQPDQVMVQELLKLDPFFKPITYQGVPDIRVILFYGFPAMAMLRLPTSLSGGRGNLHQGAAGCGVDLKTGALTYAIQNNRSIEEHPDTQTKLMDLKLPYWDETLRLAAKCANVADINYLGVDMVLDPKKGPMVLELNARPGLSIQLANQKGLLPRLRKISKLSHNDFTIEEKVQFAKQNFE